MERQTCKGLGTCCPAPPDTSRCSQSLARGSAAGSFRLAPTCSAASPSTGTSSMIFFGAVYCIRLRNTDMNRLKLCCLSAQDSLSDIVHVARQTCASCVGARHWPTSPAPAPAHPVHRPLQRQWTACSRRSGRCRHTAPYRRRCQLKKLPPSAARRSPARGLPCWLSCLRGRPAACWHAPAVSRSARARPVPMSGAGAVKTALLLHAALSWLEVRNQTFLDGVGAGTNKQMGSARLART